MAVNRIWKSGSVRKPWPLWVKGLLALVVLGSAVFGITLAIQKIWTEMPGGPTQVDLKELWEKGSYEEILAITGHDLLSDPLDPVKLVFAGFSSFHTGLAQVVVEEKLKYMDESIRNLRKALLLPQTPLIPQIHYILAKAYLYKGKYYSDLCIQHMNKALELGYVADDSYEYLGLAYSQIGKYSLSNENFLKALEVNQSDLLLWTLGHTNFQLQKYKESIDYLSQAIAKTQDRSLELKTRFLLAEVYTKIQDYISAEKEYNAILERNSNSADAYYYLGELYLAQGDYVKARAHWRRAIIIDPLHFNADQRFYHYKPTK